MGNSSSSAAVPASYGSSSTRDQIPVPRDPVPYAGPKGNYHIIQCAVDVTPHFQNLNQASFSSTIDSHYQALGRPYANGFRLATFYCIPYSVSVRRSGMFSRTLTFPYHGIYFHSQQQPDAPGAAAAAPKNERWQLTVVKSEMRIEVVRHGLLHAEVQGRTEGITQAITNMSNQGGRLICIENTQRRLAQTLKQQWAGLGPIQGVDVFFEMPLHPNPVHYTYTVASVPFQLQGGFQSVSVSCDWKGIFGQYLNEGWCLKEIYLDQGASHRAFSTTATMNSLWFFEKETALLEERKPRYQGTIVFYELKSSAHNQNLVAKIDNWGELLSSMGENGWELACILDIPEIRRGFFQIYTTLLFFFQRKFV